MNQPSIERGADDQTFHDVIEAYCGALDDVPGAAEAAIRATREFRGGLGL